MPGNVIGGPRHALPEPGSSIAELESVPSSALLLEALRSHTGRVQTASDAPSLISICQTSAGFSLAIESLAEWSTTLSVQEIAQRAEDLLAASSTNPNSWAVAVHEALVATQSATQSALLKLSICAGAFGVADAAALLDCDDSSALSSLRDLIQGSWLVAEAVDGSSSYRMLPPIRAVLRSMLARSGDDVAVRLRQARHLASIAEQSEQHLLGPDHQTWLGTMSRLDRDFESALDWTQEYDPSAALDIAAPLWQWWLISGRLTDGRNRLRRLLAVAQQGRPASIARGHCGVAILLTESGEYDAALREARIGLDLCLELGDEDGAARAATALGSANRYLGRHEQARRWFDDALTRRRSLGNDRGLATALNNVALAALDTKDLTTSQEMFEASLRAKRRVGEPRSIAIGLLNLADVMIRIGRLQQAADLLHEAHGIGGKGGDQQLVAAIACTRAEVAALDGQEEVAVDHYETAISAYQATGGSHDMVPAMRGQAECLARLGRTQDAVARLRQAEAICIESGNAELLESVQRALGSLGHGPPVGNTLGLTKRQAEILGRLADGASNKQLADELFISVATVERHLATIYRKLGVGSRVEATRLAISSGLVTDPPRQASASMRLDYTGD